MPADWLAAPASPTISGSEVHVWRVGLDRPQEQLRELGSLLSTHEVTRAQNFRFDVHRDRFVAQRAQLRLILGAYLGIPAAELHFDYNEYGKPLLDRRAKPDLRFNLSSSHDLCLIAVTCGRDVGVDIEKIDDRVAVESVPEQFFSASEVATLRALPVSMQRSAFFDCWARKEAYIKAKGMGLSLPLDSFDVSFGDGKPARLLRTSPDAHDAACWTMLEVATAPGYAAALVVAGKQFTVRYWRQ